MHFVYNMRLLNYKTTGLPIAGYGLELTGLKQAGNILMVLRMTSTGDLGDHTVMANVLPSILAIVKNTMH